MPRSLTVADVLRGRLHAQQLARPRHAHAEDVVAAMAAIQAQDYAGAIWGIGVRTRGATAAIVERALDAGALVRTHPLRGTLHVVAAADVRWLLALTAPRMRARLAGRHRQLGLDARTIHRAEQAIAAAVVGRARDRAELATALAVAGIDAGGQRLPHLILCAELAALVVSGPKRGKQPTFAALGERVPAHGGIARTEALAALAQRYFTTRGPATLDDFAWWSGLAPADARAGLATVATALVESSLDGVAHFGPRGAAGAATVRAFLLPGWDEYTVAYRNRDAFQTPAAAAIANRYGMLAPIAVLDGRVVGTWTRTLSRSGVAIDLALITRVARDGLRALEAAAARYGDFLGAHPTLALR